MREHRYPCPVCLGVMLEKLSPSPGHDLVLDRCPRCGGVWFDRGEVPALRGFERELVGRHVDLTPESRQMLCHSCHAPMDRNAERCAACSWVNRIECPVCSRTMEAIERGALRLDACRRCEGVWFDRIELAEIWNMSVTPARPGGAEIAAGAVTDIIVLDTLLFGPDLLAGAGYTIGSVITSAPEVLGAAGDVAEGTVEAAGSLFEVIADIISGLFDG